MLSFKRLRVICTAVRESVCSMYIGPSSQVKNKALTKLTGFRKETPIIHTTTIFFYNTNL